MINSVGPRGGWRFGRHRRVKRTTTKELPPLLHRWEGGSACGSLTRLAAAATLLPESLPLKPFLPQQPECLLVKIFGDRLMSDGRSHTSKGR
jgi:hypothetical protein